jgi:5-formyltetrahydrofolate cyclo-ligase
VSKINKNSFRKLCLDKLRFVSKSAKLKKNKIICSRILQLVKLHKPKKILLYIPFGFEVDIRDLINEIRRKTNIQIYVPYMVLDSFVAVKYRLPLQSKKFGIKEPKFSLQKNIKLDMMIVPIIGIDQTYRRVGFGAGMYDRFYAKLDHKPIVVFTQLKLCKTNFIVTDYYDISPDYIITM